GRCMITFNRLRPTDAPTLAWAEVMRAEGSTVAELSEAAPDAVAACIEGGLLPVSIGSVPLGAAAWVVSPSDAHGLAASGAAGWQITVSDEGPVEGVLDALVRTGAFYLRTGRSRVAQAAELAGLPGAGAAVSVFVDDVEEAVAAVADGAGDLLLRGWDTERLGHLREALGGHLVERTAVPPGIGLDAVRERFSPVLLAAYLNQIDGSGAARPRSEWAPGKDLLVPKPPGRISAQWADAAWTGAVSVGPEVPADLAGILDRSLAGTPPTQGEVQRLFEGRGVEVEAIAEVADVLRQRANGDTVTYVVNRNINYTNQCYFRCGFCAFSKGPRSLNLRGDPYLLEVHEVAFRAGEAAEAGATEVCLQGGIHPEFTGDFYVSVIEAVKEAAPHLHIHGFTPLEVWQGAATNGVPVPEFLQKLSEAGLGTLPGTAAEILDDRVRRHLCPDKITTAEWAYVMTEAHRLGLRSTATIMFGHIDGPEAWAEHLEVIRRIQRNTGGFTEFVPLPFVHMGAPIYLRGRARPGPTWDEVVLMHAVSRIAFDGLISNIQVSWVKLGLAGAAALLEAGCNDLGGTLMDENISRAAGASHGQVAGPDELERMVRSVGRIPRQRTTLYGEIVASREG
ncbi:MAG: 5-amino-6-(D-ribitylamino)uracil--L-tyrosine 4-hydroxyphenyl transferase CofH, partial [Acidimicrobiia bacterium]|nr:5-amino-6-(D-ribitylamino)uracil--L-tyrosine 4-hydroxyphenyl transferase CofH [Acidimicrobiia bacterium]